MALAVFKWVKPHWNAKPRYFGVSTGRAAGPAGVRRALPYFQFWVQRQKWSQHCKWIGWKEFSVFIRNVLTHLKPQQWLIIHISRPWDGRWSWPELYTDHRKWLWVRKWTRASGLTRDRMKFTFQNLCNNWIFLEMTQQRSGHFYILIQIIGTFLFTCPETLLFFLLL